MITDPYSSSVDLNNGVSATVTVPSYAAYAIRLDAVGDLTIGIGRISPDNARALAKVLNDAADIAEKTEKPSWLRASALLLDQEEGK